MKIIITIILIILLPVSIMIFYNHDKAKEIEPVIPKIHSWKTKNGVDTFFVARTNSNTIDVQITLDAGAARDNGKLGLAYLLTKTISEIAVTKDLILESAIDKDRAIFRFKLTNNLHNKLDKASKQQVELLADCIARPFILPPKFTEILDKLKNQLLLELKFKSQDPFHIVNIETYKLLYNKHPYANYELGIGEVDYINTEDIIDFHKNYYVTDNIIVTIVGNADRNVAINLSNLITAKLTRGSRATPLPDVDQAHSINAQTISFNYLRDNQQSTILMSKIVAPFYDVDYFDLILGNNILANNIYSRLFKLTNQLAGNQEAVIYDIYSKFVMLNKPGPFLLHFYTTKQHREQAIEDVKATLANFIDYGPSPEEVQLCKQHLINSFPLKFITNEQVLDQVSLIGFYKLPMDFFEHYIDNIYAVTKGSILNTWKKRINLQHMNTVIIG